LLQALIYGARLSPKIAAQPALQPFVGEEVLPGPECQSDEQMIAEIRMRGVSNLQPDGTCRMGREVDAVVDPRLRVYVSKGCASPTPRSCHGFPCDDTIAPDHDRREMCGDGPRRRRGSLISAATSPWSRQDRSVSSASEQKAYGEASQSDHRRVRLFPVNSRLGPLRHRYLCYK
jgi:hypothetical protein